MNVLIDLPRLRILGGCFSILERGTENGRPPFEGGGVSRARGSATCVQANVPCPPGVARLIDRATPHGPLFRLHATQLGLVRRVNARVRQYFLARPTYGGWSKLYVTWTEIRSTTRCWRLFTRNYSCLNCLKIRKGYSRMRHFPFFPPSK